MHSSSGSGGGSGSGSVSYKAPSASTSDYKATSASTSASARASSILPLQQTLRMQRINLELLMETTPKESRYSSNLVDLMKREEAALQEGGSSSSTKQIQVRDLVVRVDDLLFQETRAFFQKNVQQNNKRWRTLAEKLEGERALGACTGIKRVQTDAVAGATTAITAQGEAKWSSFNQSGAKLDLDLESMRLEEDYNRNWSLYEEFHLREAFKGQSNRVDIEWSGHEAELLDDYCARKSSITGESADSIRYNYSNNNNNSSSSSSSSSDVDSSSPQRWQHAEKQKTLVHTAPVLSPVRKDMSNGVVGGGGGGSLVLKRQTKESKAELERLDQQFRAARSSLEAQKFGAKRWMAKQEVRLLAQAGEVAKERSVIADLIAREISDYNTNTGR
jgi:hypothetical protein